MNSRFSRFCQTGLLVLGCAASSAAWEPPKLPSRPLACRECVDQWIRELRRYGDAVKAKKLWVVMGEFPLPAKAVPPDSFNVDEARWAVESFPPVILREVREAPESLDNGSLFTDVSLLLVTNVVTHICAIEAVFSDGIIHHCAGEDVFPDRIIRDPKPFGALEFWQEITEVNLLPPDVLREFGDGVAPPFPALDPSRAYVEILPGTEFSAILFHVSNDGGRPSLSAWWRFVFTPAPSECPAVKGP